jgi:hypothetical protein
VKKLIAAALAVLLALPAHADDKIGIFETIYHSDASFAETVAAIEAAAGGSSLELHGSLDVRVPDDAQQAKVFVLTSPNFIEAARAEVPRTISAQILRIAVFTWGDEQKAVVNRGRAATAGFDRARRSRERADRTPQERETLQQVQGRRPGADDGQVPYLGKEPVVDRRGQRRES